jgi:hypothetical protein
VFEGGESRHAFMHDESRTCGHRQHVCMDADGRVRGWMGGPQTHPTHFRAVPMLHARRDPPRARFPLAWRGLPHKKPVPPPAPTAATAPAAPPAPTKKTSATQAFLSALDGYRVKAVSPTAAAAPTRTPAPTPAA